MRTTSLSLLLLLVFVLSVPEVWGQTRSSSNYQIERDSLNVAGNLSDSGNFSIQDTLGDTATGRSTSNNYLLTAGYQQQPEVTLTLTGGGAVTMDGTLGGITGGESVGSSSVNASTDGAAGYQLTIASTQEPAMQLNATTSLADYVPAGPAADVTFTTDPADAHFGFSVFGDDIVDYFKTNGTSCGSGAASSTACWRGLSTSSITIASQVGANAPAGATTTIYFRVGIGNQATVLPGSYVATTTVTLLSL